MGWTHTYPRYRQTATFYGFRLPFFGWNGYESTNSKSMFQHFFPPQHSWSHLRQTNRYTYQWGEHIRTPDIGKLLHFTDFGYLFLAETDTNPPTNSKSMFQHSFPPQHTWSRLRRTNRYTYQLGEHIRTPDIGKLLRTFHSFQLPFFGWNGYESTN